MRQDYQMEEDVLACNGCQILTEKIQGDDVSSCQVAKDNQRFYFNSVINHFKAINGLYIMMSLLIIFILFAKVFKFETFKWNDFSFQIKYSWLVFGMLTLFHYYLGTQLLETLRKLPWKCVALKKKIFLEITSSENLFVRGFTAKPKLEAFESKMWFFHSVHIKDYTYWIRTLINLGLIAAVVNFPKLNGYYLLIVYLIPILFLFVYTHINFFLYIFLLAGTILVIINFTQLNTWNLLFAYLLPIVNSYISSRYFTKFHSLAFITAGDKMYIPYIREDEF